MNPSRWRTALFLVFLAVAGTHACSAQGGPPLITDDPGTPGNHRWEINVGFTQESLTGKTNFETPVFDFNYGEGEHIQLNFEIPFALQKVDSDTQAGVGNSKVGVKWRFVDETKRGISISTYPHFSFNNPTTSVRGGLADDGWEIFLPLEFSRQFGKFEANGEIGYNLQQRRSNELWMGFAAGFQATGRVELLSELHTIGANSFAETESVFDLGSRIKLTNLNTLLFAAGRSLPGSTEGQPRFFMYVGLQFTF